MTFGSEIRDDHRDRDVAGRGGCVDSGESSDSVVCSVCLDAVVDNGKRSWATLQCGHLFHLDCIGSAFNSKGSMQCPNCRRTEKGRWLYANGSWPNPEITMVDLNRDEDIYNLNYSETSLEALSSPPSEVREFSPFTGTEPFYFSNNWNYSSPVTNSDQPMSSRRWFGQPVSAPRPLAHQSSNERDGSLVGTRGHGFRPTTGAHNDQQQLRSWRPATLDRRAFDREALREILPPYPESLRNNLEMLASFWLDFEPEHPQQRHSRS